MTDPRSDYDHLAGRLRDRRRGPRRRRARARRVRRRDAVVGLRRLGHALRRLHAARPARAPCSSASTTPPRSTASPAPRRRSRCTSRGTPSTTSPSCARTPTALGLRIGAVNPNLFQDPDYKLGSVTQPRRGDPRQGGRAPRSSAWRSRASSARPRSRCGSPTAPTTPARTTCAARRARLIESLARVYEALPPEQELLLEYKPYEPAFYATDLVRLGRGADRLPARLGERAKVLVDLGHHLQGANVEQIVALLDDEGRLGGFHFNNRKYGDDDLIVGSINPCELFLIFVELGARPAAAPDDRPVAQRRGQGRGDDALASSTSRRPTPRRCWSTAPRWRRPSRPATCSAATSSCSTPTAPTCARCARRCAPRGDAAEDPVAALRSGDWMQRAIAARGSDVAVAGGWGR